MGTKQNDWRPSLLGARTLLGAPGIATRSKDASRLEAAIRLRLPGTVFKMPKGFLKGNGGLSGNIQFLRVKEYRQKMCTRTKSCTHTTNAQIQDAQIPDPNIE